MKLPKGDEFAMVGLRMVGLFLWPLGGGGACAEGGAENGTFLEGGGGGATLPPEELAADDPPPPRNAFFMCVTIMEPKIKNPSSIMGLTEPRRM